MNVSVPETPRRGHGPSARALPAGCLALALLLPACWNGAFQTNKIEGRGGGDQRFQLAVEPGRTDIDATHFLVDTATGDVWRLDPTGAHQGAWVRLADGPEDAEVLTKPPEGEADDEEAGRRAGERT